MEEQAAQAEVKVDASKVVRSTSDMGQRGRPMRWRGRGDIGAEEVVHSNLNCPLIL